MKRWDRPQYGEETSAYMLPYQLSSHKEGALVPPQKSLMNVAIVLRGVGKQLN